MAENSDQIELKWNVLEEDVLYELQAKMPSNLSAWSTVYLDNQPHWPVSFIQNDFLNATAEHLFVFRVRARNQFGWSAFSQPSGVMNVEDILFRAAELKRAGNGRFL